VIDNLERTFGWLSSGAALVDLDAAEANNLGQTGQPWKALFY